MRFPNGRETTVSVKDLAPVGAVREIPDPLEGPVPVAGPPDEPKSSEDVVHGGSVELGRDEGVEHSVQTPPANVPRATSDINSGSLRRSSRVVKAPIRYITEV